MSGSVSNETISDTTTIQTMIQTINDEYSDIAKQGNLDINDLKCLAKRDYLTLSNNLLNFKNMTLNEWVAICSCIKSLANVIKPSKEFVYLFFDTLEKILLKKAFPDLTVDVINSLYSDDVSVLDNKHIIFFANFAFETHETHHDKLLINILLSNYANKITNEQIKIILDTFLKNYTHGSSTVYYGHTIYPYIDTIKYFKNLDIADEKLAHNILEIFDKIYDSVVTYYRHSIINQNFYDNIADILMKYVQRNQMTDKIFLYMLRVKNQKIVKVFENINNYRFTYDNLIAVCTEYPHPNILKLVLDNKIIPDQKCYNLIIDYIHKKCMTASGYGIKRTITLTDESFMGSISLLRKYGYSVTYDDVLYATKYSIKLPDELVENIKFDDYFTDLCATVQFHPEYKNNKLKYNLKYLQQVCKNGGPISTVKSIVSSGIKPDQICMKNICGSYNAMPILNYFMKLSDDNIIDIDCLEAFLKTHCKSTILKIFDMYKKGLVKKIENKTIDNISKQTKDNINMTNKIETKLRKKVNKKIKSESESDDESKKSSKKSENESDDESKKSSKKSENESDDESKKSSKKSENESDDESKKSSNKSSKKPFKKSSNKSESESGNESDKDTKKKKTVKLSKTKKVINNVKSKTKNHILKKVVSSDKTLNLDSESSDDKAPVKTTKKTTIRKLKAVLKKDYVDDSNCSDDVSKDASKGESSKSDLSSVGSGQDTTQITNKKINIYSVTIPQDFDYRKKMEITQEFGKLFELKNNSVTFLELRKIFMEYIINKKMIDKSNLIQLDKNIMSMFNVEESLISMEKIDMLVYLMFNTKNLKY